MTPHTPLHSPSETRAALEATSRAAAAAHDAHVQDAMNSVVWERHGFLQVLRRGRPSPGAEIE
jgi:hypothetical protein